ncbi:MAG: lysylphosphatidylglycerol synthase transmembrane domain-containing protein [Candidatus Moraniibacteriota bacterium]
MKSWKTVLKIAATVALVYWLVQKVDWMAVSYIVVHVSLPLLIAYVGFQLAGNIISAAKWQYLARIQGFSFSVKGGTFAYLTGAFINNFLPSTVGGDTYRVLWMAKVGERTRAFATVFFDRITGLLALFLFSGIELLLLPWPLLVGQPVFIIFAAITLSVVLLMLVAFLWVERFYIVAVFFAGLLSWQKPARVLESFVPFASRNVYAKTILWASLFTAIGIGGSNYFLFSSLGAELSLFTFGSAIFAATLVANIPISINNIGVKEWSYVFFFGFVGISAELAVTAALLSRLLQMFISFIALPGYLTERNKLKAS